MERLFYFYFLFFFFFVLFLNKNIGCDSSLEPSCRDDFNERFQF